MRITIVYLSAMLFLASCVGNRQAVLLQNKDVSAPHRKFEPAEVTEQATEYRLASDDILYIRMEKFNIGEDILSVSSLEQQNMRFQIDHPYLLGFSISSEGTLDHPTFGKLHAAGRTLNELSAILNEKAKKEFPGATVEVFLINGMVTVLGEVQRAGRYPIFKDRNTILDILALAGDFQTYADRKHVKIIRFSEGVNRVHHLDLTDLETLKSELYHIQNDDIIIVSPLQRKKYVTTNIQWLVSSITALVAVSSLIITITNR